MKNIFPPHNRETETDSGKYAEMKETRGKRREKSEICVTR